MATHAYNSLLKIGDGQNGASTGYPTDTSDPSTGDPSQYTTIHEVRDFDGPDMSADDEDVTFHDSGEKVRQFIQGLKDHGTVSFTVGWDPSDSTLNNTNGLLADYTNGVNDRDYVFVPASDPGDGSHSIFFQGYINAFNPSNPVDGAMTADVTIKVNGGTIVLP